MKRTNLHNHLIAVVLLLTCTSLSMGYDLTYFDEDFESADIPSEITGSNFIQDSSGFSAYGFGSKMMSNQSHGSTYLTLTDLPEHDAVSVGCLVALIASWDGIPGGSGHASPDYFNISVDGTTTFSYAMANLSSQVQTYPYTPGVTLVFQESLGDYFGSAYDFGNLASMQTIPHTAETLTVRWWPSGGGYQAGNDEWWSVDNVTVTLHGAENPVPEPATMLAGLAGLAGVGRYLRRRK